VLAERRQLTPAQRTAIGRRLAVLGAPRVPPARWLGASHPSKDGISGRRRDKVAAMEHRDERIVVETSRYRVSGILRLPRDGYRSRLTDYLNASEREFIALTDVEIESLEAGLPAERRAFVAVSLRHVVLVAPADTEQPEGE
jgi:hypothetical protein